MNKYVLAALRFVKIALAASFVSVTVGVLTNDPIVTFLLLLCIVCIGLAVHLTNLGW